LHVDLRRAYEIPSRLVLIVAFAKEDDETSGERRLDLLVDVPLARPYGNSWRRSHH
jgi:hypothetical protein